MLNNMVAYSLEEPLYHIVVPCQSQGQSSEIRIHAVEDAFNAKQVASFYNSSLKR
jgi:hypothetical protein